MFLKVCNDQEESHSKEIISKFNQQVFIRHSIAFMTEHITLSEIFQKYIVCEHKRKKENQSKAHFYTERICSLHFLPIKSSFEAFD